MVYVMGQTKYVRHANEACRPYYCYLTYCEHCDLVHPGDTHHVMDRQATHYCTTETCKKKMRYIRTIEWYPPISIGAAFQVARMTANCLNIRDEKEGGAVFREQKMRKNGVKYFTEYYTNSKLDADSIMLGCAQLLWDKWQAVPGSRQPTVSLDHCGEQIFSLADMDDYRHVIQDLICGDIWDANRHLDLYVR